MLKFFAAVAAGLLLSGCATITRGTSNQVQIISDPSGADVRTSINQSCRTPCTLTVSRKDEFFVTVSKEGYSDETVQVRTQVAGMRSEIERVSPSRQILSTCGKKLTVESVPATMATPVAKAPSTDKLRLEIPRFSANAARWSMFLRDNATIWQRALDRAGHLC